MSSPLQRFFRKSSGSSPDEGRGVIAAFYSGMVSFVLTLQANPSLRALRTSAMLCMPLLLAAACAILVNNFPLDIYQEQMLNFFGPNWKKPAELIFVCTINVLALVVAFILSDSLVTQHNEKNPEYQVLPVIGSLVGFSCLLIMIGPRMSEVQSGMVQEMLLIVPWAGLKGLFGSFIITFVSVTIFLKLCTLRILRIRYYSDGADPLISQLFDTLLPVLVTLIFFVGVHYIFEGMGAGSIHELFYRGLRAPFIGARNNLALGALYTFLVQLAWFFGIHGPDLLDPITHSIFAQGIEANALAINLKQAPPYILTKYLFDVYIYLGGSGATLGLLIAVFISSRDSGNRRIATLSLLPGIFNINELILFGLPIVFNPTFLLPFLLTPLLLLVITYLVMLSGLVPPPVYSVDWTTPPLINGWLATGSWRGAALQVCNLVIATLVYMPFVALDDKTKHFARHNAFRELVRIAASKSRGPRGKRCVDRPGALGSLARALVNDMMSAVDEGMDSGFCLYYQPRVNVVEKKVPCVEALLRWQHPEYGIIPATLVLAIGEDANLCAQLDAIVVQRAFIQQRQWREQGIKTNLSINISEGQLQDKNFPAVLASLSVRYEVPTKTITLEVQEEQALDPEGRYRDTLHALHAVGAQIAVGDFGRGYQALSQLKRLPLAELQIDRALIRDVAVSKSCQDVIGTIQELCLTLGVRTTAEFVESHEQLETLLELNFSVFQGYLFAESLPPDMCEKFMREFGQTPVEV